MFTLHSHLVRVSADQRLHVLEQSGSGCPTMLLHGLTANAHSMEGLLRAGLSGRVLAPDLRGRGKSDKPASGYSLADHAGDIVGLMDALSLSQVVLGGHSFGALVSMVVAARYPERVKKLILLDIAHEVPGCPEVLEMIRPSVSRLGQIWPNRAAYLAMMRSAPIFAGWWEPVIESYLEADLEVLADGTVRSRVPAGAIQEVLEKLPAEDWLAITRSVTQPTLLVQANGPQDGAHRLASALGAGRAGSCCELESAL